MMSFILSRVGEHTAVADDQQPRWHHHPPPQQHLSRELPLHPRVLLSVPGRLLLLPWDGVLCLQVNNPSVWPLTLKFNSSLQQFRLLLILCDDLFSWLKLQRGRYLNVFRQHCGIKLNHRRPVWLISHRIPPAANAAALLVTFSCICSSQLTVVLQLTASRCHCCSMMKRHHLKTEWLNGQTGFWIWPFHFCTYMNLKNIL